jgi:hypothetical protein
MGKVSKSRKIRRSKRLRRGKTRRIGGIWPFAPNARVGIAPETAPVTEPKPAPQISIETYIALPQDKKNLYKPFKLRETPNLPAKILYFELIQA